MVAFSSFLQEETINFEKGVNLCRADMGSASIPTEEEALRRPWAAHWQDLPWSHKEMLCRSKEGL